MRCLWVTGPQIGPRRCWCLGIGMAAEQGGGDGACRMGHHQLRPDLQLLVRRVGSVLSYAKAPSWLLLLLRREGADRRELQLLGISDTGVALG